MTDDVTNATGDKFCQKESPYNYTNKVRNFYYQLWVFQADIRSLMYE